MNNITLAGQIFTSPAAAFAELRERPRIWVPLLVIVGAMLVQLIWYFNIVDIDWLKDHTYSGNARFDAMPAETKAKVMSMMTRSSMLWSSVIFMPILLGLMFAAIAGYYKLAGLITHLKLPFKQWFTLTVWSAAPLLVGVVSGLVMLLLQEPNAQLDSSQLQVLSANELYFHRSLNENGQFLFSMLNPFTFWMWGLSVVGVKSWSNRTWLFSTVFALLPMAVIVSIGLFRAF